MHLMGTTCIPCLSGHLQAHAPLPFFHPHCRNFSL
uniref:Uncharacterized protein n=1 Tax=Arundo donax TaxID=35708 RepID=A0A0A9B1C8_ARUDO